MKRMLIAIIVCIIIGMIINIAVAWRCIKPAMKHDPRRTPIHVASDGWDVSVDGDTGWERVWGFRWSDTEPSDEVDDAIPFWSTFRTDSARMRDGTLMGEYRWEFAGGWPVPSMACMMRGENQRVQIEFGAPTDDPPFWFGAGMISTARPLRPTFPGFLFNTLLYASGLLLIVTSPIMLLRLRRKHANCCRACGYPIGTSELCTECGKPVRARIVVPVAK